MTKNSEERTEERTEDARTDIPQEDTPQPQGNNLFRILLIAFALFVLLDIAIASWFLLSHKRPYQCISSPGSEQSLPQHHAVKSMGSE